MMKKVREGYKMTDLGEIPVEWELSTVGELIKFEGGQQPPRQFFSMIKLENHVRLIQIRDYKTDKYKTYIPIELAKRFCKPDDIMIGRYGPPIFQILRGLEGAYNVALIKAIPSKRLTREYTYYFLSSDKLFRLIDRLSQRSSGQTGVDMDALKSYYVPLPPIDEQQKIAEILSTVDEQIENTEQLIEKTRELKKGLMQQLLTKGIGHTEFKQTELGEIPAEWEVVHLNDIALKISIGLVTTMTKHYVSEGVPLIRNSDIKEGYIVTENMIRLDKHFADIHETKKMLVDDIVTVHTGDIGTSALITNDLVGAQGFATLNTRVKKDRLIPRYLMNYFNSKTAKNQFYNFSTGDGRNNLNLKDFVNTLIIVPSTLCEQQKISSILSSVDEQIESYQQEKEKYLQLKKGLMQQLLTGKMRVTV